MMPHTHSKSKKIHRDVDGDDHQTATSGENEDDGVSDHSVEVNKDNEGAIPVAMIKLIQQLILEMMPTTPVTLGQVKEVNDVHLSSDQAISDVEQKSTASEKDWRDVRTHLHNSILLYNGEGDVQNYSNSLRRLKHTLNIVIHVYQQT